MMKIISAILILAATTAATAQESFELGLGAGHSQAVVGEQYDRQNQQGDAQVYWLGYGMDKNWGLELGFDQFDFDRSDIKHQFISLAGVYKFNTQSWLHPLVKAGLGSTTSKNIAGDKHTGLGAKLAAGLEAQFKYVSVGAMAQWIYSDKTIGTLTNDSKLSGSQSVLPVLFLALHTELDEEEASTTQAPAAVTTVAKKDTDGDGVVDEDDKCPQTAAGVAVNAFGCAQTEKASVKLNIEFATGKSVVDAKYDSEIQMLAEFMKKFPQTHIEIAGHSDNVGKAAANTALSQKRADAVKAALVKAGVSADRLAAKGYGPTQPIADNKTKEGQALNRRVMAEISVTTEKKK